MAEPSKLIKTFLELVAIDSESLNERGVADYILARLAPRAASVFEDDAAAKLGGNCGNLILKLKGSIPGAPVIMLNAHMDTVKPGIGIKPVFDGDMIRSGGDTILGSDDKAGVAVIIETVDRLFEEKAPHGDLLLVFTISEEIGLRGAANLDSKLLEADFCYTLDNSGGAGVIFVGAPSHDKLTVRIKGRAAHAGVEPEKGVSAIQVAAAAISKMKLGRIDDETTANVGVIRGGRATNIIPETVVVEAEARSHDNKKLEVQIDSMRAAFESAAAEFGATIEMEHEKEYLAYRLTEEMPVVKVAAAAARAMGVAPSLKVSGGGSDANIFNAHGLPSAPLGAAMRNCHSNKEEMSVSELEGVLKFVLEIVKNPNAC
ncbi:MAG TPA: M20/M25/M40 family metallo-hydrolase [bacterium]|nr:M20/M25/M40 family metallo-hydrolase [bacterium]